MEVNHSKPRKMTSQIRRGDVGYRTKKSNEIKTINKKKYINLNIINLQGSNADQRSIRINNSERRSVPIIQSLKFTIDVKEHFSNCVSVIEFTKLNILFPINKIYK